MPFGKAIYEITYQIYNFMKLNNASNLAGLSYETPAVWLAGYNPAKDTKQCPVPNYFYKVVMKVKRSGSNVTSASTVGFRMVLRRRRSVSRTGQNSRISNEAIVKIKVDKKKICKLL
jgi:hypothetical protein